MTWRQDGDNTNMAAGRCILGHKIDMAGRCVLEHKIDMGERKKEEKTPDDMESMKKIIDYLNKVIIEQKIVIAALAQSLMGRQANG